MEQVSIFNIGQNKEAMNASMFREKVESKLFDPKLQNLQDTDTFIIRPVPYVKNPLQSVVSKNFYVFQDELGFMYFDSRTTFNRPNEQHYEFCPVSDLWLKLRNSKDPNINGRVTQLRMQRSNVCYVQIVNYPKDPSLNGQFMAFKCPMEMIKAMERISNPTEQQIALGFKPCQPFDLFSGKNLTCTLTGHMQGNTLMRKWVVQEDKDSSEILLPLGQNRAMVPVSQLKQEDVLKFFEDNQKQDLYESYGYHEPSIDVKRRVKNYMFKVIGDIPVLRDTVAKYFPELDEAAVTDMNAQPIQQQPQVVQPVQPQVVQPVQPQVVQPVQPQVVQPTEPEHPQTPILP